MRTFVLYALAVVLPPVAVVEVCERPWHRVLSLLLTVGFAWVPGSIYAVLHVRAVHSGRHARQPT